MSGPLSGIKILDLSTTLMGPYACQMLGDHGADVIKIETFSGDMARRVGPRRSADMGTLYLGLNRSKRTISIDLKKRDGLALLYKLIERSDVLVSNLRPGAMSRLGVSYDAVREVNPSIIYCSLYGYGEDGPYAGRAAYDDLIQGAAAIPSLVAKASGSEPRYAPMNMADRVVGINAACSISMALYHRQKTGQGQKIDIPMFETMASFVLSDHLYGKAFVPPLGEAGYVRLLSPDRRPYRTKDGYVCAVIATDEQWQRFFDFLGEPEVSNDLRFKDLAARTKNIDAVLSFLSNVLLRRTTAEWLAIFDRLDIPCASLNTLDSLIEDEHLNAVGFFNIVDHPSEGRIRTTAIPAKWSETNPSPTRQCARIGEHTVEVLRELGCAPAEIARLIREDVVLALKDTGESELSS